MEHGDGFSWCKIDDNQYIVLKAFQLKRKKKSINLSYSNYSSAFNKSNKILWSLVAMNSWIVFLSEFITWTVKARFVLWHGGSLGTALSCTLLMVEPICFGIISLIFGVVPTFKMGIGDLWAGWQRAGWSPLNIFLFIENLYPFLFFKILLTED